MASRVLMWGARGLLSAYHSATGHPASRHLGLAVHADDVEQEVMDHFIDSFEAHSIALFFAAVAFGLSMHLIYRHLQYYTRPLLQRQIVRIVFIIPVYSVCCAMSLSYEPYAHYIDIVRDVYEAYCIHCFLVLMLDFPGGEAAVVEGIKDKGLLSHPAPFGLCCTKIPLGADFIRNMKRTTLQFVVLKPLLAALSLITLWAGVFDSDAVQWILLVGYNISYTTALYGLFLFYLGTKSLLYGFSPVGKFSAVKVIVFATYYQSILVVMVPGMDELGGSEKWNNWIICFEMALFAVMHWYCFPFSEFQPGGVGIKDLRSQGFDEPMNIRLDTSAAAVRARIGDVCNLTDTWEDLQRLFSSSGTDHIMLGTDGGIVAEHTAQVVMDQAADAAASGSGKPALEQLASVRVVAETDVNTDKESLFASAPGARMLVRMKEGVEAGVQRIKEGLHLGGKGGKEEEAGTEDMYDSIVLEGGRTAESLGGGVSAAAASFRAVSGCAEAPPCRSSAHTHTLTTLTPPPSHTPAGHCCLCCSHWHCHQWRQRPERASVRLFPRQPLPWPGKGPQHLLLLHLHHCQRCQRGRGPWRCCPGQRQPLCRLRACCPSPQASSQPGREGGSEERGRGCSGGLCCSSCRDAAQGQGSEGEDEGEGSRGWGGSCRGRGSSSWASASALTAQACSSCWRCCCCCNSAQDCSGNSSSSGSPHLCSSANQLGRRRQHARASCSSSAGSCPASRL